MKKRIALKASLLFIAFGLMVGTAFAQTEKQTSPNDKISITAKRITSPKLVEILNYGHVRELNKLPSGKDQSLNLRLYAVPIEGSCVPDTHVVCSHHYYLAVHTFEEGLGESVFDLGEVGESDDIIWLDHKKDLTANIKITVNNYSNIGFEMNKALAKRQRKYELAINLESISVKPVK